MVIKESIINPDNFFTFDELDYQKDLYIITYGNIQLDSNGDIIKGDVTVGLRHKTDFTVVLSSNKAVSSWSDGTANFSDLDTLVGHIGGLISFNTGGGLGSGIVITQQVNVSSDLLDGNGVGDLAYVENSEGAQWNPFSTYKPAGWYVWDGLVWNSDRNAIANQLEQNLLNISANDGDILQLQTDLAAEIATRIAGDSSLQGQITLNDNEIAQTIIDLGNEIASRVSGDLALQMQIDSNDSDISQLSLDLAQEVLNRISADNSLQSQITGNDNDISQLILDLAQEVLDRIAGDEGSVSIHSDMDTSGASSNTKEVLSNNGSNVFYPRTLNLDDLDDVNTQTVLEEAGWILKHNGTEFIPCLRKTLRSSNLNINVTQTSSQKVSELVNFQRTGIYSLEYSFVWSYDSATSDFLSVITVGGSTLANIFNGEVLRQEPKDAAGNDGDGRGTNQKYPASGKLFFTVPTIGNQLIELTFQATADGVEASIWDAQITIEEEFGITGT